MTETTNGKEIQLTIRVPEKLKQEIDERARVGRRSVNAQILIMLERDSEVTPVINEKGASE
jgi:hypothetical protein